MRINLLLIVLLTHYKDTNMRLLKEFKYELNDAINNYLKYKAVSLYDLPPRRFHPCQEILAAIKDPEITWLQLKKTINKIIDNLETGWLFATGNSNLKTKLLQVLNKRKYANEAFLREESNHYKSENKRLVSIVEHLQNGYLISSLRAQIIELTTKINELEEENNNLIIKLDELQHAYAEQQNELIANISYGSPTDSLMGEYGARSVGSLRSENSSNSLSFFR